MRPPMCSGNGALATASKLKFTRRCLLLGLIRAGWLVQIDCIDSPFMSEDMGGPGRPLVATLQTTCEGEQAECLPIVANMNEYFDEAVCLQPFPLSTPSCNVTTHVV
jgi:hypothetical protein